jgi:hypothetical protein
VFVFSLDPVSFQEYVSGHIRQPPAFRWRRHTCIASISPYHPSLSSTHPPIPPTLADTFYTQGAPIQQEDRGLTRFLYMEQLPPAHPLRYSSGVQSIPQPEIRALVNFFSVKKKIVGAIQSSQWTSKCSSVRQIMGRDFAISHYADQKIFLKPWQCNLP